MHPGNEHFAEVEILSFESHCKLDGMSYEQTVNIRASDGSLIRLFDFMGFAANESRLGKNKKIIACVPFIEGDVVVLEAGTPGIVDCVFDKNNAIPSRLRLIAKVLEINEQDQDFLIDAGFGRIYVIADAGSFRLRTGDMVAFTALRLDLLEILE